MTEDELTLLMEIAERIESMIAGEIGRVAGAKSDLEYFQELMRRVREAD